MSTYADRLKALREQLKASQLDGFVVPLTDEHMSEYVGSYAQRLAWLTGFEGSAGSAVVLPEEAAIFVDGRYTLQVRQQVSANEWSYQSVPETSTTDWLKEHAPEGARIGYDPWLHTRDWVKKAKEALATRGAELVPVDKNPIDEIWTDRPEASKAKLVVQPDEFGCSDAAPVRQGVIEGGKCRAHHDQHVDEQNRRDKEDRHDLAPEPGRLPKVEFQLWQYPGESTRGSGTNGHDVSLLMERHGACQPCRSGFMVAC